jgi:hypothetical protein
MDFHTAVSKFRKKVYEIEVPVNELTDAARKKVEKYVKDGNPNRDISKYSLGHIFGENMRIAIPLDNKAKSGGIALLKRFVMMGWVPAFTIKNIKQHNKRPDGTIDVKDQKIPVLTMRMVTERTIPKGPRAGEKISKETTSTLGKLVQKEGTAAEKAWWRENQNSLRSTAILNDFFLSPWMSDFKDISTAMIVLSRQPIDVARMSDFSITHSCHTEGSSHFGCALAEARGHGAVAFLVTAEDFKKINIDDNEIFKDPDASVPGVEPLARVRIRKLINEKTNEEFAVPEKKIYGLVNNDFLPTIREWLREKQAQIWSDKSGTLIPSYFDKEKWFYTGGEYQDNIVGDLLVAMFEGTPHETQAKTDYKGIRFNYDDAYYDSYDAEFEEFSYKLSALNKYIVDNPSKYISFNLGDHTDIDETNPEVAGHFTIEYTFEMYISHESFSFDHRAEYQLEEFIDENSRYPFTSHMSVDVSARSGAVKVDVSDVYSGRKFGYNSVDELADWVKDALVDLDHERLEMLIRGFLVKRGVLTKNEFQRGAEQKHVYKNLDVKHDKGDSYIEVKFKDKVAKLGVYRMQKTEILKLISFTTQKRLAAEFESVYTDSDTISLIPSEMRISISAKLQPGQDRKQEWLNVLPVLNLHLELHSKMPDEEVLNIFKLLKYLDRSAPRLANKSKEILLKQFQAADNPLKENVERAKVYQIEVKIRINSAAGGGIETKLNRIRAISGVTVVGHDYSGNLGGDQIMHAKIKFSPHSESIRPWTYIHRVLVPAINSSKLVSGARVFEVIKSSLREL